MADRVFAIAQTPGSPAAAAVAAAASRRVRGNPARPASSRMMRH